MVHSNWTWCTTTLALSLSLARTVYSDFVSTDYDGYNDGDLGHRPHLEFQSSSEFAPILQANTWNFDAISSAGSHIFIKHDGNDSIPLSSPLILDAKDLSAVYMNRSFENVFGNRVQENLGKKYLTFWEGQKGDGIGDGYGLAFDETYQLVYKVWAQNLRVHSDLHEFAFTGNGTALVTGVDRRLISGKDYDSSWGIPDGLDILDAAFQEIKLDTNEVLFDWRALDHINPMESFEPHGPGWDAYHLNSIEKTKAGNYLISIRHTHSILLIDGQTGDIIWTLGGPHNNFTELTAANGSEYAEPILTMAWQHHPRFVPGTDETQMTLFDNHVKETSHGECGDDCSRGLHIAINETASPPTVQLLHEFQHPIRLQSQSQGSVQPLGGATEKSLGNVFIGWGRCPSFTEHTPDGETVIDVQFSPWHSRDIPDALDNYRAYKMDWVGIPWWDPAIAPKRSSDGKLLAYVSWNGATEVSEWVVRGFPEGTVLNNKMKGDVVGRSRRTGFETKLVIEEKKGEKEVKWGYLWAEALDMKGRVLRSSELVDLSTMELDVAVDVYDESNSTFSGILAAERLVAQERKKKEAARLSKTRVALLATGLSISFAVGLAAGIFWWYRSKDYNRLDAEDFALEAEGFALGSDDEYSDHDEARHSFADHHRSSREEEIQRLVSQGR
ncbi:arylsulfotransferase [Penicillium angulare]|uniref:arylsulfotransferase n=1 Tax=Penicillium angulare TaxID=116970 RepID=UPI00253FA2DD|nr:arylsulfotransferase [Penicillium angulare]KAJ5273367.1 arylsulfotransferase [Penicillium angulare]